MAILLFLMFDKVALGLKFHEIVGLVVFALFFSHIIINRKWVASVTKNFFSKNTPTLTKLGYIVNVLLLIDVLVIAISGIFISKIVFAKFNLPEFFLAKKLHFFSASMFIILLGVHIGLHWNWIVSIFKKIFKISDNFRLNRVASIFILVCLIGFGGYSIKTTDFSRWIKISFSQPMKMGDKKLENGREMQHRGRDMKDKPREEGHNKDKKDKIDILGALESSIKFLSISSIFAIITYYIRKIILATKLKN